MPQHMGPSSSALKSLWRAVAGSAVCLPVCLTAYLLAALLLLLCRRQGTLPSPANGRGLLLCSPPPAARLPAGLPACWSACLLVCLPGCVSITLLPCRPVACQLSRSARLVPGWLPAYLTSRLQRMFMAASSLTRYLNT